MTAGVERLDEVLEHCLRHSSRRAQADLPGVLAGLTALAVSHVPGVDHASVTFLAEDIAIRCLAATDGHPLVLDNLQRGFRQGPCFDAATEHRVVRVDDLTDESRWPAFTAKAVAATPVRAILALPVFRDGRSPVALNLYADRPGALDGHSEASGAIVASHVAEAMTAAHRPRAHGRSPRSTVINQAKTLLMRDFEVDVAQSFALMVKLAKQQHVSIEAVARALVSGDG
ncbi:response regulator receiver protein [Mycobacterium sp. IS-1496]|uniref:GAF and ANTAR domain-containing protein n=1 Tax=Mycobacterium sp. IS-1496 TaxID=1772284 RepID=UPI000741749C|nr:GAF and ANTAR domain-containing protein [Mycobacterium sp. IS-1496]KUI37394.1 response regulator receiver protein [Mycobacterium sp. IS-1496]